MQRKVIQLAGKTLVISLPAAWVKARHIKKGDVLEITEAEQSVTVSPVNNKTVLQKNIDITALDERTVRWLLSALHKKGYDEISIAYKGKKQLAVIQDVVKHLLIGFIIVKQTEKNCVLKEIAAVQSEEFKQTLRRAFLVTLQMGKCLTEVLRTKELSRAKEILALEKSNNQLTNFCQRILNKEGYRHSKTCFLYVITWNLEKIADEYKYIATRLQKKECTKEHTREAEETMQYFRRYYELFYDYEYDKLKMLNKTRKEMKVMSRIEHHLASIISRTTDFTSSIIALQ